MNAILKTHFCMVVPPAVFGRLSPVADPTPDATAPDRTEHITRVLIVAQGEGCQPRAAWVRHAVRRRPDTPLAFAPCPRDHASDEHRSWRRVHGLPFPVQHDGDG